VSTDGPLDVAVVDGRCGRLADRVIEQKERDLLAWAVAALVLVYHPPHRLVELFSTGCVDELSVETV
jgi:hypothetical protein